MRLAARDFYVRRFKDNYGHTLNGSVFSQRRRYNDSCVMSA